VNITLIVKEFPKTSETFISDQVTGLLALGHTVRVLSMRKPRKPDTTDNRSFSGITTYPVHEGFLGKQAAIIGILARHAVDRRFLSYCVRHPRAPEIVLYPALHSPLIGDADAVVIHYGDLAARLSFIEKRPFVAIFHGVDVARLLPALPENKRSRLWAAMTLGLPVSRFWKERLEDLGCPPEKLKVHHMGVDISRFHPPENPAMTGGRFRIVSVCRLVEKKGIDIALEALALFVREHPDRTVSYDIVGDGPERSRLEQLAGLLGIGDMVTFHGEKPQEDVSGILTASQVFILPSRTAKNGDMEGIPVSLMEAMACGLAVVSTRHSGIPELVADGVSGLLAGENDAGGIAHALSRLAGDPPLAVLLGENARRTVTKDFNQACLNAGLASLLREAAERESTHGTKSGI